MDAPRPIEISAPPQVLLLAGHELRWRLLAELARSDRQVRELAGLVGQPQSLVSYHLGRLRSGGLVAVRRSTADRRDLYYRIELERCGQLLADAAAALHPGLRPQGWRPDPPSAVTAGTRRASPVTHVLFLCTGNSARSQIAEALLNHHAGDLAEAASAGSHPKRLHPNAIRVMRGYGIDIAGRRAKHLGEFTARRFDYVISLCDRVRRICPDFPGPPELIHWSIPDPAVAGAGGKPAYPPFRETAAELDTRIRFLIHQIAFTRPAPQQTEDGRNEDARRSGQRPLHGR